MWKLCISYRRSITATLGALPPTGATGTGDRSAVGENLSIGSAGSLARHAYQPADWNTPHSGEGLLFHYTDVPTQST